MIICRWIFLKMKNFPEKHEEKLTTHPFFKNFFFPQKNRAFYKVEKYCRARKATDDSMEHGHCMLDLWTICSCCLYVIYEYYYHIPSYSLGSIFFINVHIKIKYVHSSNIYINTSTKHPLVQWMLCRGVYRYVRWMYILYFNMEHIGTNNVKTMYIWLYSCLITYFYCYDYVFSLHIYVWLPWLRFFRAFSSVVRQMPG